MNGFPLPPTGTDVSHRVLGGIVSIRETVLNALLRTSGDEVLNILHSRDVPAPARNMSSALTRILTQFENVAIADDGHTVDYRRLRTNSAYTTYRQTFTQQLRVFNVDSLQTHEKRLAFWINLYNALVIDAVISFDIQRSVTEGILGGVRFFRRAAYDIGGHRFSANDIEHGVLRRNRSFPGFLGPQFAPLDPRSMFVLQPFDARIHMALNCASRSCPPLRVYSAERVDSQLDEAVHHFLSADVEIDEECLELHLSSIFKWFEDDFGGRSGIIDFVQQYLPDGDQRYEWLSEHGAGITLVYKPHDWSLNAK